MSGFFKEFKEPEPEGLEAGHVAKASLSKQDTGMLDMAAELTCARKQLRMLSVGPKECDFDALKNENRRLMQQIEWLTDSKMNLVRVTSLEIERLRQFIFLLSAALQGKGYRQRDIDRIEDVVKRAQRGMALLRAAPKMAVSSTTLTDDTLYGDDDLGQFSDDNMESEDEDVDDGYESDNEMTRTTSVAESKSRVRRKSIQMLESMSQDISDPLGGQSVVAAAIARNEAQLAAKSVSKKPKATATKDSTTKPPGKSGVLAMATKFNAIDTKTTVEEKKAAAAEVIKASKWGDPLKKPGTASGGAAKLKKPLVKEAMATVPKPKVKEAAAAVESGRPMTLAERSAMYAASQKAVKQSEVDRQRAIKQARGLDTVKVTADRSKIGSLFEARMKKDKQKVVGAGADESVRAVLKDALAAPTVEKAAVVLSSMNLFTASEKTPDLSKKKKKATVSTTVTTTVKSSTGDSRSVAATEAMEEVKSEEVVEEKLDVLNMNGSVMMKRMTAKEKESMEDLVCKGIVSNPDLTTVTMCNANVTDAFFIKILDTLTDNDTTVTNLWFESNPLSDVGFKRLAEFLAQDTKITQYKFFANKKIISTPVLKLILAGLDKNMTVEKFSFDGFRFVDQKDKLDKILRRNADIRRKKRVAAKKAAAAST